MDNITLLAKAFAEDVMNITADIMSSNLMLNKKGINTIAPDSNIFKVSYEIFIINSGNDILDNQDKAFNIAVNLMAYLDNMPQYHGILSVYDYSILTLSHYTDDDSSGVKLSLVLQVPSPLSLCTLQDNFLDEPKEEKEDKEITVKDRNEKELDVHPIKLPRNNG